MEVFWVSKGGRRRGEVKDRGYDEDMKFESGDAVRIDPFPYTRYSPLGPVYCEFVGYVNSDFAVVKIPDALEEAMTWMSDEPGGVYIVPERYITPQ